MDAQPLPVVSATPPQQTAEHHRLPSTHHCEDNEKAYSQSSYDCGRDSVISHPFSPNVPSPPSPGTSISSINPRQCLATDKRLSSRPDCQSIQYPPRAWIDPEKHGYGSSQGCHSPRAGPGVETVVYDQGKYHEKGPEEMPWQLLVCVCHRIIFPSLSHPTDLTDWPALSLRSMRSTFCCHNTLDHCRPTPLAPARTLATMRHTSLPVRTTKELARPRPKSAVAPHLLPRLDVGIQHPYADRRPLLLPSRRIWSRNSRMDSGWLLVLFFDSRRPWRSRRTQ